MILDRLEGFCQRRFLADYWQRKPCLISGWLQPDALALDDLLGLAQDHDLPTRLVSGHVRHGRWQLRHGPLSQDDLPSAPRDWTVLVQEVDKASMAVAELLREFGFLPDWAIDDIMISAAVDGGSVGPHVDAYDVFLVQAAGKRCWELAADFDPAFDDRFELRLLKTWSAELSVTVEAGQTLYLPAGIAHHGTAIGSCQTWSVGMRTPSAPELMFALADSLASQGRNERRMSLTAIDANLPAAITPGQVREIRRLLQETLALDDQSLATFSAAFLSRWRQWTTDGEPLEDAQVIAWLAEGRIVALAPSARLALIDGAEPTRLFVNGEPIDCSPQLARELSRHRRLSAAWQACPDAITQLCELDALAPPEQD